VSCSIIAFCNTFQMRVRENEAAKQVMLAVCCTDQKDRERICTKGTRAFNVAYGALGSYDFKITIRIWGYKASRQCFYAGHRK